MVADPKVVSMHGVRDDGRASRFPQAFDKDVLGTGGD